jgi:hypothetical protein
MVESSVGLVVLMFVIFGIMEFGQLIMARQLINYAANSAARVASAGRQPATYPDGTASPSPGGTVTTAYLTTWVTKILVPGPVTGVTPLFYGSNADGSPNTSIAWNSTQFGQGFYVSIQSTYVPLFPGNRLYADSSGNKGAMVGSVALNRVVYVLAEANN